MIPAFVKLKVLRNCFLRVSCGPFVRVLQTLLVLSLVIAGGKYQLRNAVIPFYSGIDVRFCGNQSLCNMATQLVTSPACVHVGHDPTCFDHCKSIAPPE